MRYLGAVRPSLFDRATRRARQAITQASAAIDREAVRWAERQAERNLGRRPHAAEPDRAARQRLTEVTEAYGRGTLDSPSPFFPEPVDVTLSLSRLGAGPHGSTAWDLSFPSTYQPFHASARDSYLRFRENLTCHARWWRPAHRQARCVVVLLHGWRAGAYWMSERMFEVPYWLRHGFDVVAFQLPFHGRRTPDPSLGAVTFPSANLARTNEAFGHAIYDLRALSAALRRELGPVPIGALGASLGGYTTALWAAVDPELAFAVPMIPLTSVAKLMLARRPGTALARRFQDAGIDEAALEAAFAVHSPLRRPPLLTQARRFVIAGRGDRITPAAHAEALIEHWQCAHYWFDGGHLAQVGRHGALRAARLALRASGISGE